MTQLFELIKFSTKHNVEIEHIDKDFITIKKNGKTAYSQPANIWQDEKAIINKLEE